MSDTLLRPHRPASVAGRDAAAAHRPSTASAAGIAGAAWPATTTCPQRAIAPGPSRGARAVAIWRWLRAGAAPVPVATLPPPVQGALAASSWPLVSADTLPGALAGSLPQLRERLRADGWSGPAGGELLALLACVARLRLGIAPYPTQLLAAWSMLNGHLIEMATGEGKTLATGLAAAAGALAGTPVHVLTANDYLVRRDREAMQPLFDALGLRSACILPADDAEARRAAYRSDIVYLCARELAFDYLRDHQRLHGERDPLHARAQALESGQAGGPVLPGLHLALVDEADSILLDEATVPLVLSQPGEPMDVPALQRAAALARLLTEGTDYRLEPAALQAVLGDDGRERIRRAVQGAGGWLRPARRACILVEQALVAQRLLVAGRHYVVRDRQVQMVDELTGRIAVGRQWTEALHALVELKEGLRPSPALHTAAQITFQGFFPRYHRIGGSSGTLREDRRELAVAYGLDVRRVPLARPDRRRWLGQRVYVDPSARDAALCAAVRQAVSAGRPVLVGTDSVAASQRVAALLAEAGLPPQVLNALQDADEAEHIAQAGACGRITVATNMAGRGTDIRLAADAREAGGLHVIALVLNRSRRIDRQLVGRAARHGDPGSAERLLALDDRLLTQWVPASWMTPLRRLGGAGRRGGVLPAPLGRALTTWAQARARLHDAALRRLLRRADRRAREFYGFAGGVE